MKKLKSILSLIVIMGLVMSGFRVNAIDSCFNSCIYPRVNSSDDFFREEVDDMVLLENLFESAKDLMYRKVQVQYTADYEIFINLSSTQEEPMYKMDYKQRTISIFVKEFDFDLLRCIIASALVRAQIHSECCVFTQRLEDAFSQRCWVQSTSTDGDVYERLVEKLIEKKPDILNDFIMLRELFSEGEILFRMRDVALRRSIGEEVLLSMGISSKKIQEIKLTGRLEYVESVG